jgi:hypothetical protein
MDVRETYANLDTVLQIIGAILIGLQFGWKAGVASWCFVQILRPIVKL